MTNYNSKQKRKTKNKKYATDGKSTKTFILFISFIHLFVALKSARENVTR